VSEDWREIWKTKVSPQTEKEIWANLEHNIFPVIGTLPIAKVTTKVLLDCLRRIEATGRGATLRKAKSAASLIFKHAIQNERSITQNPVMNFDRHTFRKFDVKNFPALLEPVQIGKLLRAIDAYQGTLPSVAAALRLAPLLFQRIGELRTMRWADLDLTDGEWFYTYRKRKPRTMSRWRVRRRRFWKGCAPIRKARVNTCFPASVRNVLFQMRQSIRHWRRWATTRKRK
jgi:integrase